MNRKNKISKYINTFSSKILEGSLNIEKFVKFIKILNEFKKKKTVHIFGNGGSASIASHFSMDLTNNSNIKCLNYNDASLITCYSNDFGYDKWISKTLSKYGEKGDLLILISSSGKSKNMISAVKTAKIKNFYKIITLTGFNKNNPLKRSGDINLWVNSKEYNIVENIHQFWLLMLVDIIKKEK